MLSLILALMLQTGEVNAASFPMAPVKGVSWGLPVSYSDVKPNPSPEVQAFVKPVREAYAKEETRLKALPLAQSNSERLERHMGLDQVGREAEQELDFSKLSRADFPIYMGEVWKIIGTYDDANQQFLKSILPTNGWFSKSDYSKEARQTAFLIVQHATNDPDLMKDAQKRMKEGVKTGDVNPSSYALLVDRLNLMDGKPQVYGSQMACLNGQYVPSEIEDPEHVDERRAEMKLGPIKDYIKRFEPMSNQCPK